MIPYLLSTLGKILLYSLTFSASILTALYLYWKFLRPFINPNDIKHSKCNLVDLLQDFLPENEVENDCDNDESDFEVEHSKGIESNSPNSTHSIMTSNKNRIVITKEIDSLLLKIIDNLLEYYILSWYRLLIIVNNVGPDEQRLSKQSVERFRIILMDNLWLLISCFIDRLYNVNYVTFLSQNLINRLLKHFQNLKTVNEQSKQKSDQNKNVEQHDKLDQRKSFGHRKNQLSSSSIQSNLSSISSTSSNSSSVSNIVIVGEMLSERGLNINSELESQRQSLAKQFKQPFQNVHSKTQILFQNLNPFKPSNLQNTNSQEQIDNLGETFNEQENHKGNAQDDDYSETSKNSQTGTNKTSKSSEMDLIYPLASHLLDNNEEKMLIKLLTEFILETLYKDLSVLPDENKSLKCHQHTLIRTLLNDILSKILFDMIETLSKPKWINCQIIMVLKRYFLLTKDFMVEHSNDGTQMGQGQTSVNESQCCPTSSNNCIDEDVDYSDSDFENNDDFAIDNSIKKKNNFFFVSLMNDMERCIVDRDFDQLFHLIDKCNNVKLLKHVRLKLIAEILDAAVVSYLDKKSINEHKSQRNPILLNIANPIEYSLKQSWITSFNDSDNNKQNPLKQPPKHFNFNAQIDLKFKKFKQEKNIKRLISRLRYSKTLCEQKIQFCKRTVASLYIEPNENQKSSGSDYNNYSLDISTQSNDLVKSFSMEDSNDHQFRRNQNDPKTMTRPAMMRNETASNHDSKPKQKKIFKFQQIMSNEFSKEYFRMFLKQSLLQSDSSLQKRCSLMKFRKDILLVDCTVYLLEFWEHLQIVFSNFYYKFKTDSNQESDVFYKTFAKSYGIILSMVNDQRFFYTFSKQFLSIPNDLLRSLERFLLGDINLNSIKIEHENFNLFAEHENFLLDCGQPNNPNIPSKTFLLNRIDWWHHLFAFVRLERILFNCLNDEFYPQFLLSNEYDQMLFCYHQNKQQSLIDLKKKLPRELWCEWCMDHMNNQTLDELIRMRPVNKILLKAVVTNRSNEQQPPSETLAKQQFLDLNKNRKMLFNSIEFSFVYLCMVKLILIVRLRLKMTIKYSIDKNQSITISDPSPSTMNPISQICKDINALLDKDIDMLKKNIQRIHEMIMRSFCWLNADFNCVISNVHFKTNYVHSIQSSTTLSTESKIFSFVENLFNNDNHQEPQSSSKKSELSNLILQVNVTALLTRFQYHHQRPTLPISIRNELMSNWSYQWKQQITMEQMKHFYQTSVKPFARILIFLLRFNIRNYLTNVVDMLNGDLDHHHQQSSLKTPTEPVDVKKSKKIFDFFLPQSSTSMYSMNLNNNYGSIVNGEIKILEKFLHSTNQLLMEMKHLQRSIVSDLKRKHSTNNITKTNNDIKNGSFRKNDANPQDSVNKQRTTEISTISFKKLLQKEKHESTAIENIDSDVHEATEELLSSDELFRVPDSLKPISQIITKNEEQKTNPTHQEVLMKQMENLLNIFFQQITAQEHVIKSIGFLQLIGYDQPNSLSSSEAMDSYCYRCELYEYLFKMNDDHDLNHMVQLFMFYLLYDHHKQQQKQSLNVENYWYRLIGKKGPDEINVPASPPPVSADQTDRIFTSSKTTSSAKRLLFMQMRSLLSEKSSSDCLDFVLDCLKCFTHKPDIFCENCVQQMDQSKRKLLSTLSYSSSNSIQTKHKRYRLFNFLINEDDNDNNRSASSTSTFLFGRPADDGTVSSTCSLSTDLLLLNDQNGFGHFDEPLTMLPFDETQLIEPLFQLLIEIFKPKSGTVTRTLRRTLMFSIRLLFGQSKMIVRPYKQWIESFFTEKNFYQIFSQINLYLETLLKNYQQQQQIKSQSPKISTGNHQQTPEVNSKIKSNKTANTSITSQIDDYFDDLNELLCSLDSSAETIEDKDAAGGKTTIQSAPSIDVMECLDGDSVMLATELDDSLFKCSQTEQQPMEENVPLNNDEEIRDRKLQIIAKQLLFASVPTFLKHLFGQENINKGLNKCFDILQYQHLNKQLIHEFIEAFMLEYFPEFRKL